MNLIKILYWFIGIHVLAQPEQCKVGDYYCPGAGRCLTKGVVCKVVEKGMLLTKSRGITAI